MEGRKEVQLPRGCFEGKQPNHVQEDETYKTKKERRKKRKGKRRKIRKKKVKKRKRHFAMEV